MGAIFVASVSLLFSNFCVDWAHTRLCAEWVFVPPGGARAEEGVRELHQAPAVGKHAVEAESASGVCADVHHGRVPARARGVPAAAAAHPLLEAAQCRRGRRGEGASEDVCV